MNCLEFEERWDEILDGPPANADGLDRDLESHASTCQRCRAALTGYQILRQAVFAMKPPPGPSPASIERLYALTVPSKALANGSHRSIGMVGRWAPFAVAASVFALAGLGVIWWPSGKPGASPIPGPGPRFTSTPIPPARPLGVALAEVTVATIDLAREAKADASRLGRDLYEIGKESVEVPALATDRVAEVSRKLRANPAPSDLYRTVGDRFEAGVGPISGSARHAFSFLLGPTQGAGGPPAPPSKRDSL